MPNPRAAMIDEGAALARKEKVDFIIGLGGAAPWIRQVHRPRQPGINPSGITSAIWAPAENPPLFIQIPTMAGTGSEMNVAGGHYRLGKDPRKNRHRCPRPACPRSHCRPRLTLTLPKRQVAAGGFDILTHLAEFYLTAQENSFINDGLKKR